MMIHLNKIFDTLRNRAYSHSQVKIFMVGATQQNLYKMKYKSIRGMYFMSLVIAKTVITTATTITIKRNTTYINIYEHINLYTYYTILIVTKTT